ncbi:MAG: hypothetical protein QW366_03490 [Sulfolobales archaeon]
MSQQSSKSKDLKIVSRPVITIDQIKNNQKALKLLHLINLLGKVSEKNLLQIIKELKESGLDLGYNIVLVAGSPVSKDLKEDLTSLLYVGLLETTQQGRILNLTSLGREFISNNPDNDFIEKAKAKIEELKPKISMLLAESEMRRR